MKRAAVILLLILELLHLFGCALSNEAGIGAVIPYAVDNSNDPAPGPHPASTRPAGTTMKPPETLTPSVTPREDTPSPTERDTPTPTPTDTGIPAASETPLPRPDTPKPFETPASTEADTVPAVSTPDPEPPGTASAGGIIALTFDDGPSIYTPRILDLLEEYHVRSTFFVLGNRIDSYKDTVRRAAELGSEVIGHSWSHKDLAKLSGEAIESELTKTNDAIEAVLGVRPPMYRPPNGSVNDRVLSVSKNMGMALIMWSVDPRDWKTQNADAIYNHIMSHVFDGCIIICHDIYGTTADAMERVIPELIARGYKLVTVSELLEHSDVIPGKVYRNGN